MPLHERYERYEHTVTYCAPRICIQEQIWGFGKIMDKLFKKQELLISSDSSERVARWKIHPCVETDSAGQGQAHVCGGTQNEIEILKYSTVWNGI
jgi:hypothetical protein